ncbi:hypothetical protein [Micromonospora mirobrigensis]|uniref:WD40-like Beta Propeller Repeat n=1 Tax=Micromonospora mirobrigensis TaxID=262898 RepID=A0A1C4YAT4_9ACTN|nr:hypothetical protein [Micromonospora mirobrigensis]SCF17441.1 hypothetical protein GA0070564_103654 [Micromonospora mirobrigensis]
MSYRSRSAVLVAVAALCALVPPLLGGRGLAAAVPAAAADEVVFPAPGGGPRAIQSYSSLGGDAAYLLDARAGVYRKVPYVSVRVSPDGASVAVEDVAGRIGVARRDALRGGGVRWTSLPPGSPAGWSPDGTALLTTTLDKETRSFTAHRYDLPTGRLRHTPIDLDCDTCTAGWAADSVRYVVQVRGDDPELPTGPMRYLNPDGTPGPLVGAEGHLWDANAYSPSRRYAVVEPSRGGGFEGTDPGRLADWQLPRILDLTTGRTLRSLPTSWPVLGWYDERQVVTVAVEDGTTVLQVVDVHTGAVGRRVPAPGLPPAILEIGSSTSLTGEASRFGF